MKYLLKGSFIALFLTLIISYMMVQFVGINVFSPFVFLICFSIVLIPIGYIGQKKGSWNHTHLKVSCIVLGISVISSIVLCFVLGQNCMVLTNNHIAKIIGELLSNGLTLL